MIEIPTLSCLKFDRYMDSLVVGLVPCLTKDVGTSKGTWD